MHTSISTNNRQSGNTGSVYRSMVNAKFRKGYQIPVLPYQTQGIISRPLLNTRNHVIRIVPGFDPATGEVFRQNINCGEYSQELPPENYLSDTFTMANVAMYFGESKQTFITDYAPGSEEERTYGDATVIRTFIRNVFYSVNAKGRPKFGVTSDMRRWCGKEGTCRFPKRSLLVQALAFSINGRENQDSEGAPLIDADGDALPLFGVLALNGQQTVTNLMQALVEPSDPGKPLDACTNNKYGGMAELEGNKLFLNNVYDAQNKCNVLRPSVQPAGQGWINSTTCTHQEA